MWQLLTAISLSLLLSASPAYAVKVVATFLPVYIFAKNVSGPAVELTLLVPPGTDIHEFSLRPLDLKRLKEADLVLLNGAGLEAPIMKAIDLKKAADTSKGIALIKGDPHIWLDPAQAAVQVENIARALSAVDPANRAIYENNAKIYMDKLSALDAEMGEAFGRLKSRRLITFHEAFAYFARRYGLLYYSLTGPHAENPLPGRMKKAYDMVVREKVKGVFGEKQFPAAPLERLKSDLGIRLCTLDTLESGLAEKDFYEKAMRGNLKSVMECLE